MVPISRWYQGRDHGWSIAPDYRQRSPDLSSGQQATQSLDSRCIALVKKKGPVHTPWSAAARLAQGYAEQRTGQTDRLLCAIGGRFA